MASSLKIDGGMCERLVTSAMNSCPHGAGTAPPSGVSGGDGLAAVAVAIAYATFGLAILVTIGAFGWFIYVRHRTRVEAKSEVEKVAPEHIKSYLEANLPGMVAEALAALDGRSGMTGQEQGQALSEDAG